MVVASLLYAVCLYRAYGALDTLSPYIYYELLTTVTNDLDCRYVAVFSSHWPLCLVYIYVLYLQNHNDEILQSLQ